MLVARTMAVALLAFWAAAAAVTVEIKGRVTNQFTENQYQAVVVIVTDRLGVEIGRTHPDRRGQYALKITGPRYIIVKALANGCPDALYQIDTEDIKESTTDREENKAFGEMRIPTYYQNITFAVVKAPAGLDDLLATQDPADVKAYREAVSRKEAGELKQAVALLRKLIQKSPRFYIGYIELGMILAAQQENDEAIEIFTRAQELRPEHPWAFVGLGVALNNKQDYQKAAQYLEKAVGIEPDSLVAQYQLGQASFRLGDLDRAMQCFVRVIALAPKSNPMAYKTLASVYMKKQDPRNAAQALESYLVHFPDAPDAEKVKRILVKLKP